MWYEKGSAEPNISQRKERYTLPRRGENIRKRKDGRWEARFPKGKNEKGKTIYGAVYGSTYKEAKERRRQVLENAPVSNRNCTGNTFGDLLELWITDNRVRLKASTLYRYQYLIDTHIRPELGNKPTESITSTVINSYLADKLCNGRVDGSGGLSAAYVRSITLVINSALRFGMEQGLCSGAKVKINKPTVVPKELTILTPSQQHTLENMLQTDTDATKLGIMISLYTGLRIGEICALTWNDIDLKNKVIYVRNTVVRVKSADGHSSKTHLCIDTPKTTASMRCIPICSTLLPVLTCGAKKATSKYVVSAVSGFVSPRTFDYRFKKILDACQLPHINYHALRHTFATRCIEAGVDVKSLSEILGHGNVSITLNTYVHSSLDLKRIQIEKIACVSA